MNEDPISSHTIIYAMGAVIATLATYIAAGFRSRIKQANEDKEKSDEHTREMITALTKALIVNENATSMLEKCKEALTLNNIVKYKHENFNSGG